MIGSSEIQPDDVGKLVLIEVSGIEIPVEPHR